MTGNLESSMSLEVFVFHMHCSQSSFYWRFLPDSYCGVNLQSLLWLQNEISKRLKKDKNEGEFELVFSFVELQAGTLVFSVRFELDK